MNRLYAYIVRWDDGFAPNPFHGILTLACCKPEIRRKAKKGDYVVGLGSKSRGNRLVYAMRVTETLRFDEYWVASRFLVKRPDMSAGGIEALGDNIYYPGPGVDGWVMVWSQHSNSDGSQNADHTHTDIGGVQALISTDFVYWGGEGPPVPESLTFQGRHLPLTFERGQRGTGSTSAMTRLRRSSSGSTAKRGVAWGCRRVRCPSPCPSLRARASSAGSASRVGCRFRGGATRARRCAAALFLIRRGRGRRFRAGAAMRSAVISGRIHPFAMKTPAKATA